eukprot:1505366-Amphidinium_carterae.1
MAASCANVLLSQAPFARGALRFSIQTSVACLCGRTVCCTPSFHHFFPSTADKMLAHSPCTGTDRDKLRSRSRTAHPQRPKT